MPVLLSRRDGRRSLTALLVVMLAVAGAVANSMIWVRSAANMRQGARALKRPGGFSSTSMDLTKASKASPQACGLGAIGPGLTAGVFLMQF